MFLETKGLTKRFGGLYAVNDLDIGIAEKQIVGLIGPNGAGKTTTFDLITGFLRPTAGKIIYQGEDITGKKPYTIAKMGIGRSFQLADSFGEFTVLENIIASFHLLAKPHLWEAALKTHSYRSKEQIVLKEAEKILTFMGMMSVRNDVAKNMPHGYQKMLAMARALTLKPRLLLLDEPLGGMTSKEVSTCLTAIQKIRLDGVTIFLVEHNLRIIDLCDKIIVLNYGHKIAEGDPEDVRKNAEVVAAYIGDNLAA